MEIAIRRLVSDIQLPRYRHVGDAGLDLASTVEITIGPGERALIPTGIAVAIPDGYAGYIQPRSGLALYHGVTVLNSPGLVDSGFRGEIKVLLVNLDPSLTYRISKGDRIAQLVIHRIEAVRLREVDELPGSERGPGGFGSTDD
jgi:dUTP pyrophosphatase